MCRSALCVALASLGLLLAMQAAHAAVIETFDASLGSAPDAQGWFAGGTPSGSFVPAGGGDPAYFQLPDVDDGFYRLTSATPNFSAALDDLDGWTATANVRLVASERYNKSVLRVQDGISFFDIQLWDGTDHGDGDPGFFYYDDDGPFFDLPRIGPHPNQQGTISSTDTFHKIQISLDPAGTPNAGSGSLPTDPGNSDDLISIWIDDVIQAGPLPRSAFLAGNDFDEFIVGRLHGNPAEGPSSETHHNFWQFETGHLVPPPPPPSSFASDFEAGSNGQPIADAPYSWIKDDVIPTSNVVVSSSNPIGDGLGIDGNLHNLHSLGIFSQPVSPSGDGYRLTADVYAATGTSDNAIGLGNENLSPQKSADYFAGAYIHMVDPSLWEFDTRGLGSAHSMKFQNNPRDQLVEVMVEIDMLRSVATGSITFGGQTETLSTSFEAGAADPFDVISIMFRDTPALSVDNILVEKVALDVEWNQDAGDTFNTASHWTPRNDPAASAVVPDSVVSIAHFGAAITGPQTITVDAPITVREIEFENSNAYTIGGSSAITLEARQKYVAVIEVLSGTQHTISAPVDVLSTTVVDVPAGANLTIDGPLTLNNKFLTKTNNGTLTINGSLPAASSPVGGAIVVRNGTFAGNGTVDGYLNSIGSTVAPGYNGPGILTVSGHFAQGPNGRDLPIRQPSLAIDIYGLTPGSQHDVLDVVGNLTILGGSIVFTVGGGFTPALGEAFDVLDFGSARGSFDSIIGSPGAGLDWDTSQLLIDGTISVIASLAASSEQVPEPASGVLLIVMGTLLMATRRNCENRF